MTEPVIHPTLPKLTRQLPVSEVAYADGTLEAIFVPWNVTTTVYGEEPAPYVEGFRRSAFDLQLQQYPESVRSVVLMPRHGSTETFGNTRKLDPTDVGLHGVVAVLPSRRDDVRQMVDEGIDSVSIEFHPLQRAPRTADGVRWRTAAMLTGVVLTSVPAYANAKVLAMREEDLAARAEEDRLARIAKLDAELAELRAAGKRWATS